MIQKKELERMGREVRHAELTAWPPGDSWIRGYAEDVKALLAEVERLRGNLTYERDSV